MPDSTSIKQIIAEINASFSENKPDVFLAHCTDDIRWEMAGHFLCEGKEAVRGATDMGCFKEPPQFTIHSIVADGDTATCNGEMRMIQATGEPCRAAFCDVYYFENGKVAKLISYVVDLPIPDDEGGTYNEDQVIKVIDSAAQAVRDKDSDAAVALLAPEMVQFSLAPPLQHAGEAALAKAGLQEWFDTWDGPIGYEITEQTITMGDDVAFAHSLNHMTGTKKDGEKVDLWFRDTKGLRKFDRTEWKITHGHESVPFLMDGSFKAALDLKPEPAVDSESSIES